MVAGTFPADSHDPISYPFAVTKAGDTAEARSLMTFLAGPQARAVFVQRGFKVAQFGYDCGSAAPQGNVAYYSPTTAAPGTTVTICLSGGSPPYTIPPPAPKPTITPTPGVTPTGSATPGPSPGVTPTH